MESEWQICQCIQTEKSKSVALYRFGPSDQALWGCKDQIASQCPWLTNVFHFVYPWKLATSCSNHRASSLHKQQHVFFLYVCLFEKKPSAIGVHWVLCMEAEVLLHRLRVKSWGDENRKPDYWLSHQPLWKAADSVHVWKRRGNWKSITFLLVFQSQEFMCLQFRKYREAKMLKLWFRNVHCHTLSE